MKKNSCALTWVNMLDVARWNDDCAN